MPLPPSCHVRVAATRVEGPGLLRESVLRPTGRALPSDCARRSSLLSSAARLRRGRDLATEAAALEADETDREEMLAVAATNNPSWGYRRITGELNRLGHSVGASTVWRILKQHDIDPAPNRTLTTWSQFLRSQAAVACDFATIDTAFLRRYYLLFLIDITSREVYFGGITEHPTGAWTTQAARNLFLRHGDRLDRTRALVRDRGSQFVDSFDEIFPTEGLKILKTPVRTPVANTFAERWIGTLRRELLDQQPPRPADSDQAANAPEPALQVVRTPRCNGLINEYRNAA